MPEVHLGRFQTLPIGGQLESRRRHRHDAAVVAGGARRARVREESLNGLLGSLVLSLAEVAVADASARVEEVERGPVAVVEGPPEGGVVVERDREADVHVLHRATHVVEVLLEGELGCVHADHGQSWHVPLMPCANVRKRAEPVDARIGAELDEDGLAEQARGRQRGRIIHGVARSKAVSWREPPSVAAGRPGTPSSAAASVIAAVPRKARRSRPHVESWSSPLRVGLHVP